MKRPSKKSSPVKKAAIYCRVSTYNQGQGEYSSLESQRDYLQAHCREKGWGVFKVYTDTRTGTTTERPALQELIADAREKKFNVMVATKLDRISRSMKDFFEINELLIDNDIDVVFATQNIDTTSSMGRFNRNMLLAFAEFERDLIAERTREKLYSQAQKGYWGGGHVPLGYDVVDKKLIENHAESQLVREIFDQYLTNPSTQKIAEWLNSRGHRTKIRTTKKGKSTGGGEFNKQLIHDLLRNKVYVGLIKYQEESFKGLHPAIVEDTLFNSVQKRLDESTTDRFATYKDSPLLLLGLTRCGFCDHQLTTTYAQKKDGQRHFYYKCSTTSRFSESKCASRNLPAHELEDFTAKLLFHTATDNEFFEAVLKQVKGNAGGTLADKKNLRAELTKNHSTIKKQLKVVATNLTMMRLNPDTSTQIKAQIDTLNAQDKELDQQLRDIERDIQTLENQQIDKKALREVFQEFARLYSDAPIDAKRKLLNVIIEEIRCSVKRGEKTGEITYKLRGDGTVKRAWEEAKKNEESSGPGNPGLTPRVAWLREQDSNLQPCGYGRFRNFRPGPDYLITLECPEKIAEQVEGVGR